MGFFKDFKEDFSDAVDELIPGDSGDVEAENKTSSEVPLDTDSSDINVQDELNKLDGLLEQVSKKVDANGRETTPASVKNGTSKKEKIQAADISGIEEEAAAPAPAESALGSLHTAKSAEAEYNRKNTVSEEKKMDSELTSTDTMTQAPVEMPKTTPSREVSDEKAVITAGMTITGDLTSTGSIDVEGLINGNVTCNGKLTITGTVNGNSSSSEFFADAAKIEGEVTSEGTVKVGVGSVIIGNITATSAVIAGAVKGDIDVQGPVVVDTSAVVMGNIKSRSVQINNGAVIQGFCSQEYADVDVESVFA
jgi:cytoskeletal protein CcmA (bactofilin family)